MNTRGATRTYSSPLREEHAERTKEKILDALVRVLAEGPAELSVPNVAAEAGVSVPTVYRHFGSKRGLTDALFDHYQRRIGVDWDESEIDDVESYIDRIPAVFQKHEEIGTDLRAAMSTDVANRLRRSTMPGRLAAMERALEASGVPLNDRERVRSLFVVLTSSAVQRAFREYLDLGPDQAATHVAWAMRQLLSAVATKGKRGKGKR